MINSLDPDLARHFVRPDQSQNGLKGYQQATSRPGPKIRVRN